MVLLVVFSDDPGRAYETTVWPLLGFFVLPCTTLAYAFAINHHGSAEGLYLALVIAGALVDLGGTGAAANPPSGSVASGARAVGADPPATPRTCLRGARPPSAARPASRSARPSARTTSNTACTWSFRRSRRRDGIVGIQLTGLGRPVPRAPDPLALLEVGHRQVVHRRDVPGLQLNCCTGHSIPAARSPRRKCIHAQRLACAAALSRLCDQPLEHPRRLGRHPRVQQQLPLVSSISSTAIRSGRSLWSAQLRQQQHPRPVVRRPVVLAE